ncbi:MAG: tetratricopeptide repeat protein [Deltaproteobacteria bacterium]|nr:tetratricopeptide repeat protein [Deltaproteobacteria bacterium]
MSASSSDLFTAESVQSLIRDRKFSEAERICELCLANSESTEIQKKAALHSLGTCHYLQGQLSKSIDCFKKLLSIDPKHTDAAISLSIIYNDVGRYDDAKKIYQIANQSLQLKRQGTDNLLDRKFALKHIELGDLYFKYHRYDDALDDYSRAARLDPNQLDIRIKLAKVYAKKGFTTRAIQELQQLCHQHQNYLAARVHLGLMYFSQGNIIDAQLEWEKARAQDPVNAEIQTYLEMAKQATETSV